MKLTAKMKKHLMADGRPPHTDDKDEEMEEMQANNPYADFDPDTYGNPYHNDSSTGGKKDLADEDDEMMEY